MSSFGVLRWFLIAFESQNAIIGVGGMSPLSRALILISFLLFSAGCRSSDTFFPENSTLLIPDEAVNVPDLDSLEKCPYGHRKLKRIPILYGFPVNSEELTQQIENKEVVLGGCCVGSAEEVIECLECGFSIQAGLTPSSAWWIRISEDPDSFEKQISEILRNLKPPSGGRVSFSQMVDLRGNWSESVVIDCSLPAAELMDYMETWLDENGLGPWEYWDPSPQSKWGCRMNSEDYTWSVSIWTRVADEETALSFNHDFQ